MEIKNHKMKNITTFLLIILILITFSCSGTRKGIKLPKYEKIMVNDQEMSFDDIKDLIKAFKKLVPTEHQFFDDAEILLYCYKTPDDKFPDLYAIYLEEGFVYEGDSFKALADTFKNRKTKCYEISEEVRFLFSLYR